jgi:hypothetical protein
MFTTINTRREATQRIMAAKLTRLTYKIAIQVHLVAESCTICNSRSRWRVWKFLDTSSYIQLSEQLKIKLPLCLTKYHAMKTYWGGGIALRLGRVTPGERALGTHWIGGWMGGPQSRSRRGSEEIKIPAPAGDRNPIVQPRSLASVL